jgi:hypothetical protein
VATIPPTPAGKILKAAFIGQLNGLIGHLAQAGRFTDTKRANILADFETDRRSAVIVNSPGGSQCSRMVLPACRS